MEAKELKPTDLMVGDLVKWKDRYVQIATISGIVYSFGHIAVELAHCGRGFIEKHDLKSILPIPLTIEVLKTNRFEHYKETNTYVLQTTTASIILLWDYWYKCFCWHEAKIRYVHELQHILRMILFL